MSKDDQFHSEHIEASTGYTYLQNGAIEPDDSINGL